MTNQNQLERINKPNIFYSFVAKHKEKPWWKYLLAGILIVLARILLFN